MNWQIVDGAMIAVAMIVGVAALLVAAMLAIAFLTERRAVSEARSVLRRAARPPRPGSSSDHSELRLR